MSDFKFLGVYRVVEHSPYDGCFYKPGFLALVGGKNTQYLLPLSMAHYRSMRRMKDDTEKDRNVSEERELLEDIVGVCAFTTGAFQLALDRGELSDLEILNLVDLDDSNYYNYFTHFIEANDRLDEIGYFFTWKCPDCGENIDEPPEIVGYVGNGGVGINITDIVCPSCHKRNACPVCGEYISEFDLQHDSDVVEDKRIHTDCHVKRDGRCCLGCEELELPVNMIAGHCKYCAEDKLKNPKQKVVECKECGEKKIDQVEQFPGVCDTCRDKALLREE